MRQLVLVETIETRGKERLIVAGSVRVNCLACAAGNFVQAA